MDVGKSQWLTLSQAAYVMQINVKEVRLLVKRPIDPLPAYYPTGNRKQARINLGDLDEWVLRNWTPVRGD